MNCLDALSKPRCPVATGLPLLVVSAAALIDSDGRILVAQRPEGKSMARLWEFPGGKVQEGESPEFALCRELEEELGVQVRECCLSPVAFASHAYDDFHLLMPLYLCRVWKGPLIPREGQAIQWILPLDLYKTEMPPADRPLIPLLLSQVS